MGPPPSTGPSATPPRASTSTPASAPSRRSGRTPRRPAGRRCWAASAGSPGCSPRGSAGTASRCSPPPPDGVGTKVAIAQAVDKHDTIGLDLVAMVVDDLVVCGAEPLFLQDYIAVGKVVPEQIADDRRGDRRGLPAGRLRAAGRRRPPSTPA